MTLAAEPRRGCADRDALSRVAVIVPALNEERGIVDVLDRLPPRLGRVVVVDNGSTDATAERARERGACVVEELRRGYGSACLAGMAALAKRAPPDVVVFLDADASDTPEQLPELVDPILRDEADFVLASRMLGRRQRGAMPPVAVFGNRLASGLMRLAWGAPYTDLGPFRAIRYQRLLELDMQDTDYGWTIEMQIKAWRAGLRVRETPTDYRRRIGESKISGTLKGAAAAGGKILWTLARHGWRR